MASTGRKIGKRACDGCKVRKIRCAGVPPCAACVAVRIPCTFQKHPQTRGPRNLRAKTTRQIAQVQGRDIGGEDGQAADDRDSAPLDPGDSMDASGWTPLNSGPAGDAPAIDPAPPIPAASDSPRPASQPSPPSIERKPTATHSLVLSLCIYRLRLFPVWPIIAVEEIMAALHRDSDDLESYALANAVGAATMAQLKLDRVQDGDSATAASMESECRRTQRLLQIQHGQVPPMNLNALRISFFLHVFHENNAPGGPRSLLYLREAITIAQLLGLHKQAAYLPLPAREQQMRQRILWLLFVTERGVAMLHQLPVILRCNIKFLNLDDADDEAHVLPAFRRLVNLFWLFDQSGVFNLQDMDDVLREPDGGPDPLNRNILDLLQRQLREVPLASEFRNEVQTADIYVTRQWMQAILWRASINRGRRPPTSEQATSLSHPIHIAREFLETISSVPSTAVEAHGPAMEYKIYEIARAVSDAVLSNILVPRDTLDRPREILTQLQLKLASCRGGNKALLSLLRSRIAQIQEGEGMPLNTRPSSRVEEIVDEEDVQTCVQPSMNLEADMDRSCQPPAPGMSLSMNQQGFDNQNPYQAGLSDMTPWSQGMPSSSIPSTNDLFNELQAFGGSFTDIESAGILELLSTNGTASECSANWDWSGGGPNGMGFQAL